MLTQQKENKYKRFAVQYLDSPLLISGAVIIFIAKIAGDSLFYLWGDIYSDLAVTWKIAISLVLLGLFFLFSVKKFIETTEIPERTSTDAYFSELTRIIWLTIALFVMNFFLPESIKNYGNIPNYFAFLLIELLSVFSLLAGMYILFFLLKWFWFRRHRKTKRYIWILAYMLVILMIFEIPFHYYHISAEELAGVPVMIVLSVIFVLAILSIIFLTAKKNTWIAVLPKNKKLKLLVLYFVGIVLSIIFMALTIDSEGEGKFSMAVQFTFGSDTLLFLAYYCAIPYFIRLMFATLMALPTTQIVERATSEITSLTYLNRVVSKTMKMDELIETLTVLALQTCRGIGSWTELYESDGNVFIGSTQYISEEHIKALDKGNKLHEYLKSLEKPLLVQSIKESPELANLNWSVLPMAKSLISIPLFTGTKRVGTLTVLHPEEYGLERDDLRVMEAFGDNINLALENAKHMKDSLEKERYKSELNLAREMEEKLLPINLPNLSPYSVSAFSMPAKEVGGDYYDIVELKNGKKCILVGDVSGKGMSSAFYMAQLKGVVLAVASEAESSSDILIRINNTLHKRIEKKIYITLSALVIDDIQGNISYSRAGHMPLILKQNTGILSLRPKGIGIGLANPNVFNKNLEEIKLKLNTSDIAVMFTDGINELRNNKNEELGFDNLKQFLNNSVYNKNADNVVRQMKENIENFLGNEALHDDMTLLAIVYNGEKNSI